MKIIFDRESSTERELEISYYSEQVTDNRFNASKDYDLKKEAVPDLSDFKNGFTFSSVDIDDEGYTPPIIGSYNKISSFSTNYIPSTKIFSINITLGFNN